MSFIDDLGKQIKKVPVAGPLVGAVQVAVGTSTFHKEIYEKSSRAIKLSGGAVVALSAIFAPAVGAAVAAPITGALTKAALKNGTLKKEIGKLTDAQAKKVYAAINVHPLLMTI